MKGHRRTCTEIEGKTELQISHPNIHNQTLKIIAQIQDKTQPKQVIIEPIEQPTQQSLIPDIFCFGKGGKESCSPNLKRDILFQQVKEKAGLFEIPQTNDLLGSLEWKLKKQAEKKERLNEEKENLFFIKKDEMDGKEKLHEKKFEKNNESLEKKRKSKQTTLLSKFQDKMGSLQKQVQFIQHHNENINKSNRILSNQLRTLQQNHIKVMKQLEQNRQLLKAMEKITKRNQDLVSRIEKGMHRQEIDVEEFFTWDQQDQPFVKTKKKGQIRGLFTQQLMKKKRQPQKKKLLLK